MPIGYGQRTLPRHCKELLMRMACILVILTTAIVAGFAEKGKAQRVSIHRTDATLKAVIADLRSQTGYGVMIDKELLTQAPRVTVDHTDAELRDVLDALTKQLGYTYAIEEKQRFVVIEEAKSNTPAVISPTLILALPTVTGKIIDSLGNPLQGASIRVLNADGKRTTLQTLTDSHGEFTLRNVPDDATLEISSIGYATVTLPARANMGTVVLKAVTSALQEVEVSTGYWTTTRELSVGNIAKVTAEELERQPVGGNALLALHGRVAGMEINQGSGYPGRATTIRIRGRNSMESGSNPLFVIDGVPQYGSFRSAGFTAASLDDSFLSRAGGTVGNQFFGLNIDDIESIEVLKDADATAIYGSRGANGVILITTKKAKAGDIQTNLSLTTGMSRAPNAYNLLNTPEYLMMRREAYRNDGVINYPANAYDVNGTWDTTRYTNWQDELMGNTAQYHDIQASLSGNSAGLSYLLNLGYHRETTVTPGEFFDSRKSVLLNVAHQPAGKPLSINLSISYANNISELSLDGPTTLIALPPNAPALYDDEGNLNWENGTWMNPLSSLYKINKGNNAALNSNLTIAYRFLKTFQFKVNGGYNSNTLLNKNITYSKAYAPNSSLQPTLLDGTTRATSYLMNPQLEYEAVFDHLKLQAMAGFSLASQSLGQQAVRGTGFTSEELIENVSAAGLKEILGTRNTQYNYASGYGRINLNYSDKYLLNLTANRDGSSRFGDGRKFSNFYAIGTGWLFAKEAFNNENLPFLTYGKLRGSYGLTGNDQIGDYRYLDSYVSNTDVSQGYYGIVGMRPSRLVNDFYSWEKVRKLEGGLELGFWQDRLNTSVSYFHNESDDQLLEYRLPISTGFPSVTANQPATVINKGLEVTLDAMPIQTGDFSWRIGGNVSFIRNKLKRYDDLENSPYASNYVIGYPLDVEFAYRFIGINAETGLYDVEDVNEDGRINLSDRILPIDASIKYFGGIDNTFSYRNIRLDFLLQFVNRPQARGYLANLGVPGAAGASANRPKTVLDRWQQPGDDASLQRFTTSTTTYGRFATSDAAYENGSYVRLKNVSMSYDFASIGQLRRYLRQLTIYGQAQNLLTFSRFSGLDPETGGGLPPMRTLVLGLKAGF